MTISIHDNDASFPVSSALTSDQRGLGALEKDVKSAGAALWQDVYSHRKEIELGTAALAGTAIALYAGRESLAKLLPAAKEVLLVEDTPFMGQAMKSALETNGERVTWVTGFKSANPLTATTLSGKDLILDPGRFKVALVDGELTGSNLQGEHVVRALHADGVTSIGTSTIGTINDVMRANGAELAAKKSTILSALVEDQLDLAGAVRTPGKVQGQLDDLTSQLSGPQGKEMRQKADQLLARFIKSETGV